MGRGATLGANSLATSASTPHIPIPGALFYSSLLPAQKEIRIGISYLYNFIIPL